MQIIERKAQPLLGPGDSIGDLIRRAKSKPRRPQPIDEPAEHAATARPVATRALYRPAIVWSAGVSLAAALSSGFVAETNWLVLGVVVLVGILCALFTLAVTTLVRRPVTAAVAGGVMGFFVASVFGALYEPMCVVAVLVSPLLSCLGLLMGESSRSGT